MSSPTDIVDMVPVGALLGVVEVHYGGVPSRLDAPALPLLTAA